MKKVLRHIAEIICEKNPVATVKLRYLQRFGCLPDLKHPKSLNEKILFLKLFTDTSQWTQLADKYRVRDYVKSCGLEHILVPLLGAWEHVGDIPFSELPQQFMLKANNGDGKGTNVKVDKAKMSAADWDALRKRLQGWLDTKHIGALSGEPQYRGIKPMIVAEEFLPCVKGETSLTDYKLWCFDGKPYSFLVCSNRQADGVEVEVGCYDLEWNIHPENMLSAGHVTVGRHPLSRPKCLDEMIRIAKILSKPFPQVRVDFYEVDGKVYFGELTFTSLGGMMNYYTPDYLLEMGSQVMIPGLKS